MPSGTIASLRTKTIRAYEGTIEGIERNVSKTGEAMPCVRDGRFTGRSGCHVIDDDVDYSALSDPMRCETERVAGSPDGVAGTGYARNHLDELAGRKSMVRQHRVRWGELYGLRKRAREPLHGERRTRLPWIAHQHEERRAGGNGV